MPELPEVEHLRRTLEPLVISQPIGRVRVLRRDVITTPRDPSGGFSRQRASHPPARLKSAELLSGDQIVRLHRLGKQLALEGASGRVLLVHLGMTGRLEIQQAGRKLQPHTHIVWSMLGQTRMAFSDPRRFGGAWTFPSLESLLQQRWDRLGPDALTVTDDQLASRLATARRPLKSALLDQNLIAGLGNIYVDESCHRARVHPCQLASKLSKQNILRLTDSIRSVLETALSRGGSTIRDYADALGQRGSATSGHLVYGRAGKACTRCGKTLDSATVSGRMTVWCPKCQILRD